MGKKTGFLIFLAVFLACSWFFSTGSWNQVSRIDAIMSFVEPPVEKRENPDFLTFRINHFLPSPEKGFNTGDWSYYKGNYYSNKAPGPLFLGILTYAPLYWSEYLLFGLLDDILTDVINLYIINLVQSALPAALAAWILFHILLLLGYGKNPSAFWSLAYGLCTPVFCYSTMMWGHVLAAGCFMFAIYFYLKKGKWNTLFCGLCCGYAVLSDYLCGVLVPVFAIMLFLREYMENSGKNREKILTGIKTLFYFALGGLPMFLLYAMYHKICFDSFFTPATVFNNPLFHDKEMVGGTFGAFKPFIILKLLISQHRGLLYYSPVLLFFLPGFFRMIRADREKKLLAAGLFSMILLTICAVATFNGWHGGASCFARYLIVIIPAFIVLCGAFSLDKLLWKLFAIISFSLSYCYMLITAYLNPLVNEAVLEPIWGLGIECLRRAKNTLPAPSLVRMYSMIENLKEEAASYSAFSIGELFGFSGYGSMILLTSLLAGLIAFIYREDVKKFPVFLEKIKSRADFQFNFSFSGILLTLVCILLFVVPGMTVWINDEPRFILLALKGNDDLFFVPYALRGNLGIFYGASGIWFYQMLLLLTFDPYLLVLLKVFITVAASIWAIKTLCRTTLKLDWKLVFVFLFASPFAWHYARVLWDNVLLFPLSLALLAFMSLFFQQEEWDWKYAFAAGICGAFMLLLHPMSVPLVALFPFALFGDILLRKKEKKIKRALTVFAAGCIAALPAIYFYLPQILKRMSQKSTVSSASQIDAGGTFPLEKFYTFLENISGYGYGRHFLAELVQDDKGAGFLLKYMELFLLITVTIVFFAGIFALIRKTLKKEFTSEFMLGSFCFAVLVCKIIMDFILKLEIYPHYQMAVTVPGALLILIGAKYILKENKGILFIKAASCIMLCFTIYYFLMIYCHDGTKSFVYGPTLGNQYELVEKVDTLSYRNILGRFRHGVKNYNEFPHALQTLFFLKQHTCKKSPKEKIPQGVKYDVIMRYAASDNRSGLLVLDIQQSAGPQYDIANILEK